MVIITSEYPYNATSNVSHTCIVYLPELSRKDLEGGVTATDVVAGASVMKSSTG